MRVVLLLTAGLSARRPCGADMYDLEAPDKLPPASCVNGCARWSALAEDGSRQGQAAADTMWVGAPPEGVTCAMPGRAVQCCNMYNASTTGAWPNCHAVSEAVGGRSVIQQSPPGLSSADFIEEYADKAGQGLRDSPLCYPSFPTATPGLDGAFCEQK